MASASTPGPSTAGHPPPGVGVRRWVVRVLGVEVLAIEAPGTDAADDARLDDIGTAHVVGFVQPVVEVREPLPDRESW